MCIRDRVKAIAREAGARTKLAVWSKNPDVDPVGACIGARGVRVEKIVQELNGEKIDVIRWSEDITEFISAALSPAKVCLLYTSCTALGLAALIWLDAEMRAQAAAAEYQPVSYTHLR